MSSPLVINPVNEKDLEALQPTSGKEQEKASDFNVLALAYYYVVQMATTSSETAVAKAKQLNAIGKSEQQLNREAAALKWNYVPKEDCTKHNERIPHYHWTWDMHNEVRYTTYTTKWITTHANAGQVSAAEEANQRVSADRAFFTQKLNVLQQIASVEEGHVNSIADESTQDMQQGSMILQIIQSLTFKALLRPPTRF